MPTLNTVAIRILPLDFMGQGALLEPRDAKLHDAAVDFCNRELAAGKDINLSKFAKVWVGLRDEEVKGIMGYVLRPDVPLLRSTDGEVLRELGLRMNDYFADQGAHGQEVFLYIGNEKPEQRCMDWLKVLKEFHPKSARRLLVEIR
jgi:hypothetical protein